MTAYKLIAKEKSIENVISAIKALNEKNLKKNKKEKYHMPAKFEFQNARELFKNAKTETFDNARVSTLNVSSARIPKILLRSSFSRCWHPATCLQKFGFQSHSPCTPPTHAFAHRFRHLLPFTQSFCFTNEYLNLRGRNSILMFAHFLPQLKWSDPDKEGLVNFLTNGKGFSSSRVLNGLTKI